MASLAHRYRPARADLRRQDPRHPVGIGAADRGDLGHRLRDAVFGGERQHAAVGVTPDDPFRDRPDPDDRGRADRHPLLVSPRLLDLRRCRCCWSSPSICAASSGMGAQRWIDLGVIQLQPSEIMKIALVLALARYFHSLSSEDTGRISYLVVPALMIVVPAVLVLKQPDLGTAMMLLADRRRPAFPRRRAAVGIRARARSPPRPRRRSPGRCCAITRRPGSIPFSTRTATRSAPAITFCNRRSRSVRAGLFGKGFLLGTPKPSELPAGEADRFHLHDDRRGVRAGRRAGAAGALYRSSSPMPSRSRCAAAASSAGCSAWGSPSISSCTCSSIRRW